MTPLVVFVLIVEEATEALGGALLGSVRSAVTRSVLALEDLTLSPYDALVSAGSEVDLMAVAAVMRPQ